MELKLIKTESDYPCALKRLEVIFDAPVESVESDESDILGIIVDEYKKRLYPIEAPAIEAIKLRMEGMHLKQIDLINEIGGKSRVSEILSKKRKLTVEMIRNLTRKLNLSPELLITDYKIGK